jgi:hypothetical protein
MTTSDTLARLCERQTERIRELEAALEGIATGYGGAGGDDEGESFEETVAAMRKDANAALTSQPAQKQGD